MKNKLIAIAKEMPQFTLNLLGTAYPQVSIANLGKEFITNASNLIFMDKLSRILLDGNEDFFEWLKIAENFDEDSENYQNAVRQLIYSINAMNETELLSIYANLLRAYKAGGIGKDEFYRLGWILSNIFSEDLRYLENCYGKKDIEECPELKRLEQRGLVYISTSQTLVSNGVRNLYTITDLGTKMLSCGIDYEHYNLYQEDGKK